VIRAVLDTNVYVAAVLSRTGAPAQLVTALAEGLYDAVACPLLLGELEAVLSRPKIASRVTPETARDYLAWLSRVVAVEADPTPIPRVCADPGDDYLLALAVSGRAQVIVSGDAHLLDLTSAETRVMPPAAFAQLVESLR
jgi:putative PIN family toxin of toxin-antitoxin system